jgi:hypothetical protein
MGLSSLVVEVDWEPPVTGLECDLGWSRAAVVVLLPAGVLLVREQEPTPEHAGVHGH